MSTKLNQVRLLSAILCWMLTLAAIAHRSCAQDDPFGDDPAKSSADAFSLDDSKGNAITAPQGGESYLKTDPLIRRIRQQPPQTPAQMAKAITWMVQIRSWENVGGLLDQLAGPNWSVNHRAEAARAIDKSIWSVLLQSAPRLSDAQNKSLKDLYSAPAALARDPQVVQSLIEQLANENANQRRIAELRLQDAGLPALSLLLERLINGDSPVAGVNLASAIHQFDRDGLEALRAACVHRDSVKSGRVMLAIAELDSKQFSTELAAALYSARYTSELKSAIAQKIKTRFTKMPGPAAAADFLARSYQSALDEYQFERQSSNVMKVDVWRIAADGTLLRQQGSRAAHALERLAQIAVLQASLASSNSEIQAISWTADLQRAYSLTPTVVDQELAQKLIQPLSPELAADSAWWTEVFRQSTKLQMHGAAVRSLQLLDQAVRANPSAIPLDFLSQLLKDQRPIVRYLALSTIAAADPRQNFAGSSQALTTALEMTALSQGPQALIIGANLELCLAADQILQQHTRTASVNVTSAREAYLALAKTNPIEMILVVDRVHDASLFEMLQRLRNANSLPITVMLDNLSAQEERLINQSAGMHLAVLSRDPDHLRLVLDDILAALDVHPMTEEERAEYSAIAGTFLTRIAADRATYAFYPVGDWQQEIIRNKSLVSIDTQAQMLSGLSSSESQLKLAKLAAAHGAAERDRIAAAKNFSRSAKQFGVLLSDAESKSIYELYNRLGPTDPAIATALGYILDVVEAQAGAREWPDPLP
jgi:hypothetical protein